MGRRAFDQTEALRQCRETNAEKDAEIERLRARNEALKAGYAEAICHLTPNQCRLVNEAVRGAETSDNAI